MTASGEIFNLLKILGAVYLVYLGVKIWFSPIVKIQNGVPANDKYSNPYVLLKHAFFVTSSNPKALVYVSALLPQFINTQQPFLPQVIILALTSAMLQFIIFMSYVILSSKARSWIENPNKRKIFNKFSGLTFIGFGVALGLSENKI